jgi:hypothetical protein
MIDNKDFEEILNKLSDIESRIGVACTNEYIKNELNKVINRGRFISKNSKGVFNKTK